MVAVFPLTVIAGTYYVSPSPQHCPVHHVCHTLSYYVANSSFTDTSSTFVFTEGKHILRRHINVVGIESMVLTTFRQGAQAVIRCRRHSGLAFTDAATVNITGIVFRGCGGGSTGALAFNDTARVSLRGVAVADSPTRGVAMARVRHAGVRQSLFNNNQDGGLDMIETEQILITECSIFGNRATSEGGGIRVLSTTPSMCPSLTLTHTDIIDNTALYGGALLVRTLCSSVAVSDSRLVNNTAQRLGGGMRLRLRYGTHNITVQRTTLQHNAVLGQDTISGEPPAGGGIYIYITQVQPTTLINILDCVFDDNQGLTYGGGIAINRNQSNDMRYGLYFVNTTISHNKFTRNMAYYGSAVTTSFDCSYTVVSDNQFLHNGDAGSDSTLYTGLKTTVCAYTIVIVDQCLFLNNTGAGLHYRDDKDYFGISINTGVYSYGPSFNVSNSVFEGQMGAAINLYIQNTFNLTNVTITNTKPPANANPVLPFSVIYLDCFMSLKLTFYNILVYNNTGTGIHLKNCQLVDFDGYNLIANNNASQDGGGPGPS